MTHIHSLLHTRIVPDVGGGTYYLDLVAGWEWWKAKHPDLAEKLIQSTARVNFTGSQYIQDLIAQGHTFEDTLHPMVFKNAFNQQDTLFLGAVYGITIDGMEEGFTPTTILKEIEEEFGYYKHMWEEGDMVIWDNTQVMHRSSGAYEGKRLLIRVQVRDYFDEHYGIKRDIDEENSEINRVFNGMVAAM